MTEHTVSFTCTPQEYALYLRRCIELNPALVPNMWPARLLTAALCGGLMYFVLWFAPDLRIYGAVGGTAWALLAYPRYRRRNLQRALDRTASRTPAATFTYGFRITPSGLHLSSEDGELDALVAWTAFSSIEVVRGALEFHHRSGSLERIPLRAFDSEEAAEAFELAARASLEAAG